MALLLFERPGALRGLVRVLFRSLYLRVGVEHKALDFIHRVHPICHGSKMEAPEHHFILSKSSW